ncbi:MAG: phosphoribosylformylglycinamidine cyclo-ligase [Acidobacteriota bacterium]
MSESDAYRQAGVDIDAQDAALGRIKKLVRSTRTPGVLGGVGSFGGLFCPDLEGIDEPVLVSSADGVGTKLMVAKMVGDYSTVGRDLVNHCVNDILVQGATPLFFLDYVGTGVLEPDAFTALVQGLADGCRENGCALLGGETAEMPGFYQPGDYELVGFIVGMVDRSALLDGSRVSAGDMLLALPSSGLHTNGYSLARHVFFERLELGVDDPIPGVEDDRRRLGEILLEPHRSYLAALRPLLGHPALHGLAHITGGGITDNLPRILPAKTRADIRVGSWRIPDLFHVLQRHGEVSTEEMFRVFNMGVGMILAVEPSGVAEVLEILRRQNQAASPIGIVQDGAGGVVYDLGLVESNEAGAE